MLTQEWSYDLPSIVNTFGSLVSEKITSRVREIGSRRRSRTTGKLFGIGIGVTGSPPETTVPSSWPGYASPCGPVSKGSATRS